MARRLRDERGYALVLALAATVSLSIAGTSVVYYTTSNSHMSYRHKADQSAYSLAEAGLNDALNVISAAQDPRIPCTTINPDSPSGCVPVPSTVPTTAQVQLDGGSAYYWGTISYSATTGTYTWALSSKGSTKGDGLTSNVTRTLRRSATVRGLAPGSDLGSWNRFYHDSTSVCLTVDTVTIPMPIASRGDICLKNGAKLTGATVDVGDDLTVQGPDANSGPRSPTAATGTSWNTPSNVYSNNGVYTTYSVGAGGTSNYLSATGFGFSIPSTAIIRGITVYVDRKASVSGYVRDSGLYIKKSGCTDPCGSSRADTFTYFGTSDYNDSHGGTSDLWGKTWTAADINSSSFGAYYRVYNSSGSTATASVDQITITVTYSADVNAGIGASGANITQANIFDTCTYNAATTHKPCTSADRVYADNITQAPENLVKPTLDLAYWYDNAKPGPKHNCTTGSYPNGGFDNDTVYNNSRQGSDAYEEITPTLADYTCQVWENGVRVGELSWNHTTHVLTIKGTIFFDGDVRFDDGVYGFSNGAIVHYQGRGIIYAAGDVEYDEVVCAGGSGSTNCLDTGMSSWSPASNMIVIFSGGNSEYDQDGRTCSPTGTASCPNGHPASGLQGILYAAGTCTIHEQFNLSGPVVCGVMDLPYETDGWPNYYTWPSLGSLVDGQKYMDAADAVNWEIAPGDQTG